MLSLCEVYKHYLVGDRIVNALIDINLKIESNGLLLITGESGSGKTTLLNILSGIDKITSGTYYYERKDVDLMSQDEFDNIRRNSFGVISQECNLFENETVIKNIEYAAILIEPDKRKRKILINEVIKDLSIESLKYKKVSNLSGGEKQRVAIARALVKKPQIIFADEITSNLDEKNSITICELLKKISKSYTVIVVSHDEKLFSKYADRIVILADGKIIKDSESKKSEKSKKETNYSANYKKSTFFGALKNFSYMFLIFLFSFISLFAPLVIYDATTNNVNTKYSISTKYASTFKNISKERNIIIKNDKSSFDNNDYDYFRNLDGFKTIMYQDVLLDNFFTLKKIFKNVESKYDILIRSIDEIDNVNIGVMPTSDFEVITNKQFMYDEETSYISFNNVDYYDIKEVGIINQKDRDENSDHSQIYYLSNNLIKVLYADFIRENNLHLFNDGENEIQSTNIYLNDKVEKGCIVTTNKKYENKYINVSIDNGYQINHINNLKVVIDEERKIIGKDNKFDDIFVFNKDVYVETVNKNFTQISVFSNKRIKSDEKYNVFYPNINKGKTSEAKVLYGILFTLLFITLTILISFATLFIINKISKTEINNYVILWNIGYSNKQNLIRLIFRNTIPIIISTIVNIVLFVSFNLISSYANATYNYTLSSIFIGSLSYAQIIIIPIIYMVIFIFVLLNNIISKYKIAISKKRSEND